MSIIKIRAGVRYAEDAIVNGVEETNESPKMPFMEPSKEYPGEFSWNIEIDVETGVIVGWKEMFLGTTAKTYYKVCDCLYFEYDGIVYDDYVPRFLSIFDMGYGDYIYLEIDGDGRIKDWNVKKFKDEIEKIRDHECNWKNAGRDEDACAHDTAAYYPEKVVQSIDDIGGYRKIKCEDIVRWVDGKHVLVSKEEVAE